MVGATMIPIAQVRKPGNGEALARPGRTACDTVGIQTQIVLIESSHCIAMQNNKIEFIYVYWLTY